MHQGEFGNQIKSYHYFQRTGQSEKSKPTVATNVGMFHAAHHERITNCWSVLCATSALEQPKDEQRLAEISFSSRCTEKLCL